MKKKEKIIKILNDEKNWGELKGKAVSGEYLKAVQVADQILELLKAQKKEIIENLKEEVEGMGKLENGTFSEKVYLNGYNQALSQVLKLIKDKQK